MPKGSLVAKPWVRRPQILSAGAVALAKAGRRETNGPGRNPQGQFASAWPRGSRLPVQPSTDLRPNYTTC